MIADFVPLIGFSRCGLSIQWKSASLPQRPSDSNTAHLLWTLTQSPTLSTFIGTCGVLTSALSLRCRKWLFWSITYKSGIMDINLIKVKEYLKTYGIKNHFKSLNEAIFKTNLRLITSIVLSLFPASYLQEHVFLVSGYPSLILCFWHCYQKYNSKPPCGKSTPAPCKEQRTSMATEAAPERASADKSPTFPLRCERDLKRKALYHWERLAVICLQHFSP